MFTFIALVRRKGSTYILSNDCIKKQFKTSSLVPFDMNTLYHRELSSITSEQSDFLAKLLGEDVDSFSRNWVEFRFEYTQLMEI